MKWWTNTNTIISTHFSPCNSWANSSCCCVQNSSSDSQCPVHYNKLVARTAALSPPWHGRACWLGGPSSGWTAPPCRRRSSARSLGSCCRPPHWRTSGRGRCWAVWCSSSSSAGTDRGCTILVKRNKVSSMSWCVMSFTSWLGISPIPASRLNRATIRIEVHVSELTNGPTSS